MQDTCQHTWQSEPAQAPLSRPGTAAVAKQWPTRKRQKRTQEELLRHRVRWALPRWLRQHLAKQQRQQENQHPRLQRLQSASCVTVTHVWPVLLTHCNCRPFT